MKKNETSAAKKKTTTPRKQVGKKVASKKKVTKKVVKRVAKKVVKKTKTQSAVAVRKKVSEKKQPKNTSHQKGQINIGEPRVRSVSLRNRLQLLMMVPYQFPIAYEQPVIQVARFTGVAFIAFGVVFSAFATGLFQGNTLSTPDTVERSEVAVSDRNHYTIAVADGVTKLTGVTIPGETVTIKQYALAETIEVVADADGVYSVETGGEYEDLFYTDETIGPLAFLSGDTQSSSHEAFLSAQSASALSGIMAHHTLESYELVWLIILAFGVVLAGILLLYLTSYLHVVRHERNAPGQGD